MAKKPTSPETTRFTDTKRVKELISLMADNGLTEIELVEDKSRIVLRRGTHTGGASHAPAHHAPVHHTPIPPTTSGPVATPPAADANLLTIKSPMVGTFYSAANPESDPYISIGASVDPKTVVCMIEAMKVFNEIHAELSGTITKILVSNGQAVEFGQPLFLVNPN